MLTLAPRNRFSLKTHLRIRTAHLVSLHDAVARVLDVHLVARVPVDVHQVEVHPVGGVEALDLPHDEGVGDPRQTGDLPVCFH